MQYVLMFFAGIIGLFLYIFRKIAGIRKRRPDLTKKTIWSVYWDEEWNSLGFALFFIIGCIFASSEWLHLSPTNPDTPRTLTELVQVKVIDFVKTIFIFVGYCANALGYALLGTAEQKLLTRARDGGVELER